MPFAKTDHLSGSTDLVEFPSMINEEGSYNANFFPELGKYFEDHFAFRPQMVTANAFLRNNIFKDSGTDQVVVGNDGFYYFSGTLDDYLGKNDLTDRDLKSIANNLSIIQNYVESHGSNFAFAIAPNKNTLYPSFMPYYYKQTQKQHNADRLKLYLKEYGIHYIDMFDLFFNDDDVNYLKEDSHWSNRGALKATNNILQYLTKNKIEVEKWQTRNDRDGDIYAMMYPSIIGTEVEDYAIGYNDKQDLTGNNWKFIYGNSVEDSVSATNSNGDKYLYMYRDSFANAMIPYLSSAYEKAVYSKLIPYNLVAAIENKSSDVLIERAERHLSYLCEVAPLMPSPIVKIGNFVDAVDESNSTLQFEANEDYVNLFGSINPDIFDESKNIYIQVEGQNYKNTFRAFCLKDNSYYVRINRSECPEFLNIKIMSEQNSCIYMINEYNVQVK